MDTYTLFDEFNVNWCTSLANNAFVGVARFIAHCTVAVADLGDQGYIPHQLYNFRSLAVPPSVFVVIPDKTWHNLTHDTDDRYKMVVVQVVHGMTIKTEFFIVNDYLLCLM